MIEEKTYKVKFELVEPWTFQILSEIKRELKNDHLPKNPAFSAKYFSKKAIQKLTVEEMSQAYLTELKEGNEELGEWVASRWVLKNTEVYQYFVTMLERINPNYDEIEEIEDAKGDPMMQQSCILNGAIPTYIFSVFNQVAFTPAVYEKLREKALAEMKNSSEAKEEKKIDYEEVIRKLTDKYEKKLLGLQNKYTADTASLKKQIANLHRKQNGCG